MEKPYFIKEVRYVETPALLQSIGKILEYSILGPQWPFQNSLYYNKKIENSIMDYYREIEPSVVFFDMIRLVSYANAFEKEPVKKIFVEDDSLAKRYKRQILASKTGNVIGQYGNNKSAIFNRVINIRTIKNAILRAEIKRIEKYEANCVGLFDYVTFISPIETREYNCRYKTKKAVTLTMGADVEYFSKDIVCNIEPNSMSIVANCTTAANADSIEMICRDILPKVQHQYNYKIVGKYNEELKKKIYANNVQFIGYVDDIRSIVKSTQIYLSPMSYGSGIKTKIVEAMAMGMTVVTNSIGAEGLDVENGRELFVIDDKEELVRTIDMLFDNPDLCKEMGKVAQKFVREKHSWSHVYKTFDLMELHN
ncbi:MAG: glycosyltransferase [Lachnospiraceae bacterium]|nr:glycosyltransferase [Lachnospiraceae bacterium]